MQVPAGLDAVATASIDAYCCCCSLLLLHYTLQATDTHVCAFVACYSDHFQVLQLVSLDAREKLELVDVKRVRRRYKELAILVHPDKSKAAGAEEAFKRLSVAYECLSDESSQRSYLRTLLATRSLHQAPKRPRPPPPPPYPSPGAVLPSYPRKKKMKKSKSDQPPPPPPRDANAAPSVPRRQRTPEEIWKQFQEEEEGLAREEFLSKGFERTYASSDFRQNVKAECEKPSADAAVQELILNSDLHEKAQNWTKWKKSTSSSPFSSSPPSTPSTISRGDEDASDKRDPVATEPELICCLLCRRKFSTHEALSRHKSLSKLHLANLQRAQAN